MIKIKKIDATVTIDKAEYNLVFDNIEIPNHPEEFELLIKMTNNGGSLILKNLARVELAEKESNDKTDICLGGDPDKPKLEYCQDIVKCEMRYKGATWETCEFGEQEKEQVEPTITKPCSVTVNSICLEEFKNPNDYCKILDEGGDWKNCSAGKLYKEEKDNEQ